jgi:hypothetical protein
MPRLALIDPQDKPVSQKQTHNISYSRLSALVSCLSRLLSITPTNSHSMHIALTLAAVAAVVPALADVAADKRAEARQELAYEVHDARAAYLASPQAKRDALEYREAVTNSAVANSTELLIGGGSSYAPYTVDCPSDVTWIRSAREVSVALRSERAQSVCAAAASTRL